MWGFVKGDFKNNQSKDQKGKKIPLKGYKLNNVIQDKVKGVGEGLEINP